MTRDEHEAIICDQKNLVSRLERELGTLYKKNINNYENDLIDTRCKLSDAKIIGSDPAVIQAYEKEVREYEVLIKHIEKECGIISLDEEITKNQKILETMRNNARIELNVYEFFTSSAALYAERIGFFSCHGLIESSIYKVTHVDSVFNLNDKFNQDKDHLFLEGVAPYLKNNRTLPSGEEVVLFVFNLSNHCCIARDNKEKLWYLLLQEDIVFSDERLENVFDYKNIVE